MKFTHGGDIYRNRVNYDFSANINPLGMPKESMKAAKEGVMRSVHYPDYLGEDLCNVISQKEKIGREQILLGNGAAELLYVLAAVIKPKRALLIAPTFSEYEASLQNVNCEITFYRLQPDKQFQIGEDILQFITEEIDMVYICNPNNPTGYLTDRELLHKIAKACDKYTKTLVVDECFLHFTEKWETMTMVPFLKRYRHLVIVKAFTKLYAMPGLRLGYLLSQDRKLIEGMRKCMQPWNTSIPAQMAGIAALRDCRYLKHTQDILQREKKYLLKELRDGLADEVYGNSANYIFFMAEEELGERLLQEGIMIRDCSNFQSLTKGYYRIAVRTHSENVQLIVAWRRIRRNLKWQK